MYFRTTNARAIAGIASMMNTHCQPCRPQIPSMPRIAPETTDASALATGTAMKRVEITRAR
ncbi:hypothetical protein D3C83_48980 [compost metagenome]